MTKQFNPISDELETIAHNGSLAKMFTLDQYRLSCHIHILGCIHFILGFVRNYV